MEVGIGTSLRCLACAVHRYDGVVRRVCDLSVDIRGLTPSNVTVPAGVKREPGLPSSHGDRGFDE